MKMNAGLPELCGICGEEIHDPVEEDVAVNFEEIVHIDCIDFEEEKDSTPGMRTCRICSRDTHQHLLCINCQIERLREHEEMSNTYIKLKHGEGGEE